MPTYLVKVKRQAEGVTTEWVEDIEIWGRNPEAVRRDLELSTTGEILSVDVHPTLRLPDPSEALANRLSWWAIAFQAVAVVLLVVIGILLLVALAGSVLAVATVLSLLGAALACFFARLLLLFLAQYLRNTDPDRE